MQIRSFFQHGPMDHRWIYHILLGTTEFFCETSWWLKSGKYSVRYGVSSQVFVFTIPNGEPDFLTLPSPASGSFDSRVNTPGRLGRDEAFDGHTMVGWSCSYGTWYGGGGLIVGTLSYFAFKTQEPKSSPSIPGRKIFLICRAFSCLQGVLWYGGRWSNPPVGIWSITPCAAPRWRGCKTMPYSHHGGFQYCFAKCCWERPVWMNSRDGAFWGEEIMPQSFCLGDLLRRLFLQFWQTWRIRPLDEQTWQWK